MQIDPRKKQRFLQMLEDKDKVAFNAEAMLGIAFTVLRIYVLALVGINLSILAVISILLYTDYDVYQDLIMIVPSITLPFQATMCLFGVLALAPWFGYCVVTNCFSALGFLQCIWTLASVSMWVFACLGLDIIYRDDTFHDHIIVDEKYERIASTMEALFWMAVAPLWLSAILCACSCVCMTFEIICCSDD